MTKMNTDQARAVAAELRRYAKRVEEIMDTLDTTSTPCDCCGTTRYSNWQQNGLWQKFEGIAERLEVAASILAKKATDPEFLGEEAKV